MIKSILFKSDNEIEVDGNVFIKPKFSPITGLSVDREVCQICKEKTVFKTNGYWIKVECDCFFFTNGQKRSFSDSPSLNSIYNKIRDYDIKNLQAPNAIMLWRIHARILIKILKKSMRLDRFSFESFEPYALPKEEEELELLGAKIFGLEVFICEHEMEPFVFHKLEKKAKP